MLVESSDIQSGDRVLEIGPGLGIVTEQLLSHGAEVVAVELDRQLADGLRSRWKNEPRLQVVTGDIRTFPRQTMFRDGGFKLVSSLPFNITSLVLRDFLEHRPRPSLVCLLIQREVAERITAGPGEMSVLSAAVQYLSRPNWIEEIPRDRFFPSPAVDGAIVRLDLRPLPSDEERRRVFHLVKIGFAARRKMLKNTLRAGLTVSEGKISSAIAETGLNTACRAQELSVAQWKKLAQILL